MSEWHRRLDYTRMEDAEKAIWNAMHEVEGLGIKCKEGVLQGDSKLLEAIELLKRAKHTVSDYIDGVD